MKENTYVGRKVISVKWLHAPLPHCFHTGPSDGLCSLLDLFLGQETGTDPGAVKWPANVANLVYPGLQRANPVADEGSEQVIRSKLLVCDVLLQHIIDSVDFNERLPRVEVPIELLVGRG